MKSFLVLFLVVLFAPNMLLAQTTTQTTSSASTTIETITENITDKIGQIPVILKPQKIILSARSQTRIINLAANISNRYEAILARLINITARLETRTWKLNQAGHDTSSATASLQAARTALQAGSDTLVGIDEKVVNLVGSQNPQIQWAEVRATYTKARDNIKDGHRHLRTAIGQLKNSTPIVETTISSSTQTNL